MSQRNMGRQPGPGKVRAVCCIRSAVGHVPGLGLYGGLLVKSRVGEVDVFRVHLFLAKPQTLTEAINLSKCHQTLVPQGKNRDMEGASARSISCQERGSEGIYIGL